MHILVVDDDIPTVEVIRTSLHWDLLGIDRVETAYDYTEAQNKICASQPDIILCDIEMPRGSGLDLLRWLREEKRDCEFVFLTCHANFDYAKTALQYGAADYITKPFNIAQTEATLSKVASQVRYHQELLQKSRAGQQWEEAHSLAQTSFLHGLFMDGTLMTEIELNKRFQDLGLAVDALQPIHMVLVTAPQPADDTSWKPELFGYAFRNLATELLCENAPAHVFHFLRQDMHFCLAWLDGSLTPDIVAQRCRGELILETDQLGPHNAAQYSLDVAKLEQLFAQGSVPAITNLIRKDLSTLAEEKMLSPALMQQIHQDFQQVLYSVLSANEIQAHELFRDDACVRLNQTAESSIMNMIKWVSVAADRAVRTIRETHQVNSIAGKIRQYCQEHFAEKISNREIADAVYLTPDYANRVFKDAYGLSIKDYLTDLRMQKAQLLLRDEANTISEVAAQVGFDNFSYFSTQFKKYTGLTPNEWKRQNG